MKVKIVHDDLNSGGGAERLAIITIETLKEMGFEIDIETFTKPDFAKIRNDFGRDISEKDIGKIIIIDLECVLDYRHKNFKKLFGKGILKDAHNNDNDNDQYRIIINTHGDLLPYCPIKIKGDENKFAKHKGNFPIIITYCHYPLVPLFVANQKYNEFLNRFIDSYDSLPKDEKKIILQKALIKYNEMMRNTIILTNSNFSKNAIERIYGKSLVPKVVYPPVDIAKFSVDDKSGISYTTAFNSFASGSLLPHLSAKRDSNSILVIARFSPYKNLENVIEIGKILKDKGHDKYKMILIGNVTDETKDYVSHLKSLIMEYNLGNNVKLEPNTEFPRLLSLVQSSSIYLHPTIGEPFGISIVEAMSGGLIPIAPNVGGCTEFVPLKYQYRSIDHAADIIYDILTNRKEKELLDERKRISELAKRFAEYAYKKKLEDIIITVTGRQIISSNTIKRK